MVAENQFLGVAAIDRALVLIRGSGTKVTNNLCGIYSQGDRSIVMLEEEIEEEGG